MLNSISFLVGILAASFSIPSSQVDEAAAIKQLEEAGGRVVQIAANTEDREVSLYLAGESITDEHVALLKEISNIKWLNLANTSVTDAGLEHLQSLQLSKLHLEKTAIGDAGLEKLKDQKELVYLNLYQTKVSNEGLKHLVGLSKLKKLYVWQTAVDQEGIDWLSAKLPDLKIVGAVKMEATSTEQEPPKDETKKATENKSKGKS